MPNQLETSAKLLQYMKARVPLIVVRSIERTRALDSINYAARQVKSMTFYTHSRTQGLFENGGAGPISDDRSLVGAFEYATKSFQTRNHTNFIFTDIEDLESESSTSRHLAEMVRLAEARQGSVIVIASEPVWAGLARLGMSVTLELPNEDELLDVVRELIEDHRGDMNIEWTHEEIRRAAEILVGVTQSEAINAITSLLAKGSLSIDDVDELSQFKDQIFGELSGIDKVKVSDYTIGGLTNLRAWLQSRGQLIKADLKNNLRAPKGVLLVGVPGCGKSLSAKAIASEWRLPLYRLDMASVLGMYVGQSEGQFKAALEAADRVAPCVLWIDEIEKGFASGSGDSGTTRRLIGQFLFWLQESTSKVFVVATANDVSSLPPELLRKGRFDEMFFVDLPDDDERREIIRLYFARYLDQDPSPYLLDDLVVASEGFSGADIDAAVHDIGTEMFLAGTTVPDEAFIKKVFGDLLPFSRTNPEEVAAIRAWGRDRAKPAGSVSGDDFGGSSRRVVITT